MIEWYQLQKASVLTLDAGVRVPIAAGPDQTIFFFSPPFLLLPLHYFHCEESLDGF